MRKVMPSTKVAPFVLRRNYIRSCVSCLALKPLLFYPHPPSLSHFSPSHLFNIRHLLLTSISISLPTMKNPLSSTISFSSQYRLLILTLLLFFVISTATRIPKYASLDTSSRNHRDSFKIQRYSPSSFPRKSTSSYWCNQFQRMKGGLHLGPPPPPPPSEIDPIYGVEKRLVPSGPNPLHNWSEFLIFIAVTIYFNQNCQYHPFLFIISTCY
jgi:hypothetical protein